MWRNRRSDAARICTAQLAPISSPRAFPQRPDSALRLTFRHKLPCLENRRGAFRLLGVEFDPQLLLSRESGSGAAVSRCRRPHEWDAGSNLRVNAGQRRSRISLRFRSPSCSPSSATWLHDSLCGANRPASKTVRGPRVPRGFESHPLRWIQNGLQMSSFLALTRAAPPAGNRTVRKTVHGRRLQGFVLALRESRCSRRFVGGFSFPQCSPELFRLRTGAAPFARDGGPADSTHSY
jgi:hypothetical protein